MMTWSRPETLDASTNPLDTIADLKTSRREDYLSDLTLPGPKPRLLGGDECRSGKGRWVYVGSLKTIRHEPWIPMLIKAENVVAGYGRLTVLDGLSWEIGPGVTGLLGPNGAGKTTLLHLLVGITKPTRGTIAAYDGSGVLESTEKDYGRRIGFVPQHFTFAAEMCVVDTITYAAWVNGVRRKECREAAERALDSVDLLAKAGSRVRSLSGGQRQRLGVATALAHEPDLLILDEPTVGLDPTQRLKLREVIASIGARRPVVISTHLVEDVNHLCQRVGILAVGKMAFDDDVDKLVALVEHQNTRGGLGSAFEKAYAGIIDGLVGRHD